MRWDGQNHFQLLRAEGALFLAFPPIPPPIFQEHNISAGHHAAEQTNQDQGRQKQETKSEKQLGRPLCFPFHSPHQRKSQWQRQHARHSLGYKIYGVNSKCVCVCVGPGAKLNVCACVFGCLNSGASACHFAP